MDRFCRICFNSKSWREPTGEASGMEVSSYAQANGYGHEEWLFNYETLLKPKNGKHNYKYSYLQPIGKLRDAYLSEYHNLMLYTVGRNKERLAVGIINNVYVPSDEELEFVRAEAAKNGLIDRMISELMMFSKGPAPDWHSCPAKFVFNVRFKPEDVEIFDPFRQIDSLSPVYRLNRYHPLKWDVTDVPLVSKKHQDGPSSNASDKERSEAVRHKCAVFGVSYSPQHVRLQNSIYKYLKHKYGANRVHYERNYVDLTVITPVETIFYEIKVLPKAKNCIRQALGQVIEYCHYAQKKNADKLIVVGDVACEDDDRKYLNQIRSLYNLPVFYQRWNRASNCFDELI